MSTLVELPPAEYSRAAFDQFHPEEVNFAIGNARAMIWFSQLAYETGKPQTIELVRNQFGFTSVLPFVKRNTDLRASFDTCGIIGERPDAVVLAFAGTDPAVWENLVSDTDIRLTPDKNTHQGFQAALDAVQDKVDKAVQVSQQGRKPLFVAGHSLGAALAVLAAQRADAAGAVPKAIYIFGMPRAGGETFRATYNARLGQITFRLVHGLDIVARVPGNGFRHVGRLLQCHSGEKFDPSTLESNADSDEPEFLQDLAENLLSGIGDVLSGHVFQPPGPGPFGPLFKFLPQPIRDHLQDRYWTALAPPS
jgi:triacylglycerol lipase